MSTINKINVGGTEYEIGGGSVAKLVASYTYTLDSSEYGLSEYFTDETDTLALKENTMYLIEMEIGGYPSQITIIGKTGKKNGDGNISLITQTFLLPPSAYNTDKYSWIPCYLEYTTWGEGSNGTLSVSAFEYDFDENQNTYKTINKFTVNFYEMQITIGGNE
jgi:hypothetical protein